jgi:hypothetical protein
MMEKLLEIEFYDSCDDVKNGEKNNKYGPRDTVLIYSTIMCPKSYSGLSPFLCQSSFVLVKLMLYLTLFHSINGFNLDTDSRIELNGTNAGSYFGYTVAMLNQNDQNRW